MLRAFLRDYPDIPVTVVTELPDWFLQSRFELSKVRLRRRAFDVGMVQKDSVRVDLEATLSKLERLRADFPRLLKDEICFLQQSQARAVVCDIPALPLTAASQAGVSAIALGNFSWDWIYDGLAGDDPRWRSVSATLKKHYASSDLLLKYPLSPPMQIFSRQKPVPLVARAGKPRREEVARLLRADPEKTWVLLSFTTLELDEAALSQLRALSGYQFFTVLPLEWPGQNLFAVSPTKMPFSDLVASVDVVVSKPGFGILSDTIVNNKPLIYVERESFAEYPVMVEGIQKYLRNLHLPAAQLYRGNLEEALEAVARAGPPPVQAGHPQWPVVDDGAAVVAAELAEICRANRDS